VLSVVHEWQNKVRFCISFCDCLHILLATSSQNIDNFNTIIKIHLWFSIFIYCKGFDEEFTSYQALHNHISWNKNSSSTNSGFIKLINVCITGDYFFQNLFSSDTEITEDTDCADIMLAVSVVL